MLDGGLFGRSYLETYYPIQFPEQNFLSALQESFDVFAGEQNILDVKQLSQTHGISLEVAENASIFSFLFRVVAFFCQKNEKIRCLLDVGGGPTVYQHIPLALITDSIIHAEFDQENIEEVVRYLKRKPRAYDWSAYFRVSNDFLHQEERLKIRLQEKWPALYRNTYHDQEKVVSELEERVREVVKEVVRCDIFRDHLALQNDTALADTIRALSKTNEVDIVTSHFVLESATNNVEMWRRGFENIMQEIKPGGYMLMTAIRNAHWYMSGDKRVPSFPVDENFLAREFKKRGFSVPLQKILIGGSSTVFGYDGMIFLLAQKKNG